MRIFIFGGYEKVNNEELKTYIEDILAKYKEERGIVFKDMISMDVHRFLALRRAGYPVLYRTSDYC